MIKILKAKLQNLTILDKSIHYEGSIGIDKKFLEISGILPYEEVLVVNVNNGQRFETYVIEEEYGSSLVVLRGAAARLGEIGDKIIVMAFRYIKEEEYKLYKPKIIVFKEKNEIANIFI
ncbi:MAG: aspartate 1-decarboxylase [candidate division WOR-3 bacterium]|nr:aspartate 1-decarboxylase [candidate division WOR-3 bacterium]MDW8150923.1 aspartate 1-decarboxylase [candidate division WOR-3 bacterium]